MKKLIELTPSQADVLSKQFFDKYVNELRKTVSKDSLYLLIESLEKYASDFIVDIT